MPTELDLEIIIATYNSEFWLKKTLHSLKEHFLAVTEYTCKVTVVDNASSDETLKLLQHEFSWVHVVALTENYGFSYANNRALEQSSARYYMLLNSDVEFTEQSNLDTLITYADEYSEVGIITPRLEFTDGTIDPACHRGEPTLWAAATYFSGLESLAPDTAIFGQYHQGCKDLRSVHTIDACSGAALIIRHETLKKVGLLDEQFFMYAEDLDWCKRVREAGYNIVYNPEVTVIHHKNKSGIKSSSQALARATRRHFYDTMIQYYDKHYQKTYPPLVRKLIRYLLIIKQGAL